MLVVGIACQLMISSRPPSLDAMARNAYGSLVLEGTARNT
jgi:hypothetical protein